MSCTSVPERGAPYGYREPAAAGRTIPWPTAIVQQLQEQPSAADEATAATVKALSVGNLKQTFTNEGREIDWFDTKQGEGHWFLEHAVQVKNIWVPYGE